MKVVNNLLSKLFQKTGQAAEERIEADRVLPRSGSGVRLLNNKLLFIPIAVLLLFILATILLKFVLEPTAKPQNVFISNISDHQATISWTTDKPTKGAVVASENGSFPILPIFVGEKLSRDDGEKGIKKTGFYTTHRVTVENLAPGKEYQFRIYEGWKNVYQEDFSTGPTLSSLANPNPVYGKIVDSNNKPIVGALVYLTVSDPASEIKEEKTIKDKDGKTKKEVITKKVDVKDSSILSALTNSEGKWSIDLGNIRSKNLKSIQPLSKISVEKLLVDAGRKGRAKAVAKPGMDKPWVDIVLK
ncbi:MAG: hypothetical protein A3D24_01475 [Candidatus Blackburnbacteria bacterium RIFCSPHIGHO2_02_FULL_39_13]|uniref:Fibronectin type-III domain-containing protein n=1 Tax=Candidatus Blackburnbacteria bacterium RIFCSPLOWO2_01_FULL_40_20 TaxID=1797519 RepID=A0A1G1VCW4_9BACT|nr:MAG: hypothetical protein UT38_C0010G0018 [Microgenomates group bacterium GW2011_GWA2_39_19]OGY06973.1 MAG: hypothetical protein A2694_02550 [Candidatus Blackburnbacteria bacterium RIFCSPHIGHO2_01_FULL_40_17]OGY08715.1 MAG: hypothetical protein A3D24_01475 [Candidatus Blackburnbacteria bacterium RIFCSPHIGHO2_02_FULL_39_13]OGY13229.1 MAG: hypothetical protein A3A77_01500 [Candidatus Blackburnbacteria bacterium RIFCSPLOWO2_01_FULL_40_20]HBL52385.1 hypothetical protein [Candidatus Blackburnbact